MSKILIIMILFFISIKAEVKGMILNKDKLLIPKSEKKIDPKKILQKRIEAILQKSKQVKELSKRYSQIALFYKNQLVFKIQEKNFEKKVSEEDMKFIIHTLKNIEKSINETKLIVIKDRKNIKKLEEQI